MNDWLVKNKLLLAIVVVIVLAIFYISAISSPLPNPNFTPDDLFRCNIWENSNVQSVENDIFVVSSNDDIYYYSSFAPEEREFSHYSNDCSGDGCSYLGRLENMQYYGRVKGELSASANPPLALVDSDDKVYACYPVPIS
jgi:hypothetical protein